MHGSYDEIIDRWAVRNYTGGTVLQYSSEMKSLAAHLDMRSVDLLQAGSDDLRDYVTTRLMSNPMRKRFLCAAHGFFRWARRSRRRSDDPSAQLRFKDLRIDAVSPRELIASLVHSGIDRRRASTLTWTDLMAIAGGASAIAGRACADEVVGAEVRRYVADALRGRQALRIMSDGSPALSEAALDRVRAGARRKPRRR